MNKLKNPSTFVFGLVFGTLIGLLVWYWYKATSAEDGALDLLDRLDPSMTNRFCKEKSTFLA